MVEVYPKISIVVPVYSGAATLSDLVDRCAAIRSGVYADIFHELIFVCDEPIDASESVLATCISRHDWIKQVSLARNSGQHMATAVGILYSSGDWILTIDEDLQHPPEILPELLVEVLSKGLDLLYIRSRSRVHVGSVYRDISSNASKYLMRIFTRDDYSIISSFRLLRGEIARSVAISVDAYSYLDAALYAATGQKRRGVFYAEFQDHRHGARSGYTLLRLLQHYVRLILAAELSGFRITIAFLLLFSIPLLLGLGLWLVYAFATGTAQEIAPGWLSLFALGLSIHFFLVVYFVYSLKLLYVILSRGAGIPPFLVLSRSIDVVFLASIRRIMDRESFLGRTSSSAGV